MVENGKELITTDSLGTHIDGETVQTIGNIMNTLIGLSCQMSENNAAKYKAQAEVYIKALECELDAYKDDNRIYLTTREQQYETVRSIITCYNEAVKKLVNAGLDPNCDLERIRFMREQLDDTIGKRIQELSIMISDEQEKMTPVLITSGFKKGKIRQFLEKIRN